MKKIFLSLLVLLTFSHADETNVKAVYDLTTKDIGKIKRNILKGIVAHKSYYQGEFKELDVAVVIHGGAYRYFLKKLQGSEYEGDVALQKEFTEIQKRLKNLADTYNVEFMMCELGAKKHKVINNIVSYVKIIPNSDIGLITKQNEGYAYIPVGD